MPYIANKNVNESRKQTIENVHTFRRGKIIIIRLAHITHAHCTYIGSSAKPQFAIVGVHGSMLNYNVCSSSLGSGHKAGLR